MAFSRILSAQELTLQIVRCLDNRENGALKASANLAALAKTCKAFNGPATEVLWSTLPSLVPLFKLLPQEMWALVQDEEEEKGPLNLARRWKFPATRLLIIEDPSPDDMDNFKQHAKLLKRLWWSNRKASHAVDLHSDSLDWLTNITSEACESLFPALRELICTVDDESLFWRTVELPRPNLKSLAIACHSWFKPQRLANDLADLPDLESLAVKGHLEPVNPAHFGGIPPNEAVRPPNCVLAALQNLPQLRQLTLDGTNLNTAELHLLGELPLDSLALSPIGTLTVDPPAPAERVTGRLRSLRVRCLRFHDSFFPAVRHLPDRLQELVVQHSECAYAPALTQYFNALSKAGFAGTLEHLRLFSSCSSCKAPIWQDGQLEGDLVVVGKDVFRPLLAFTSLRSLNLVLSHLVLGPRFLGRLADALPCLEECIIVHRARTPESKYPLISSVLIPFAQHCPRLAVLGLDLDIPPCLPSAPAGLEQTALRILEVGQGTFDYHEHHILPSPEEVAAYVTALFPGVERIGACFLEEDNYDRRAWLGVHEHLRSSKPLIRDSAELLPAAGPAYRSHAHSPSKKKTTTVENQSALQNLLLEEWHPVQHVPPQRAHSYQYVPPQGDYDYLYDDDELPPSPTLSN